MKKILPHFISIVSILTINVFYFWPQFEGKLVPQVDIISFKGMSKEAVTYQEKTGEVVLWTNAMFGGMPTYQISAPNKSNKLSIVEKTLQFGINQPAGFFILGMICFYVLMLVMGVNPWLALLGAILFGLSTNNLILYEAGHTSKIRTIMVSPLIISGMVLTFRKKYLYGLALFTIGLGINIYANHLQMTYYLAMVLGVATAIEMINSILKKDFIHLGKSLGVFLLGSVLAILSSGSRIMTTYEYSKDTMRGKPILEKTDDNAISSSEVDGLEWEYAMSWSNGVLDLFASFIPGVVGGSSAEKLGKDAKFVKAVGANREIQAPTYWGSLPFTSGPIYFGIVTFLLFIMGIIVVKDNLKWWIVAGVLLTLLISLGKNLEFFNRWLFEYMPLFNKFRTPNSVLSITAILIPILGVMAVGEILKSDDKNKILKPLLISVGVLSAICAFFAFLGGAFFDFSTPGDARYEQLKDLLYQTRKDLMTASAIRSLVFTLLTGVVIWFYLKDKISSVVMIGLLIGLSLVDLVEIGKRYLGKDDFVSQRIYNKNFEPREVDKLILRDTDPHYRVLDLTINTFNSASTSYHHKTIGGYHAAKLQRYQDLIDRHISTNNMNVINMLNTKYFIFKDENGEVKYQLNPAALGNAWFVSEIKIVDSANEEIDALSNFEPSATAIVHKEFETKLSSKAFIKNGTIKLKSYSPNKLVYESDTSSPQFAVFSEIWYGPNKGWKAYINGNEAEHIRVNYALRGLEVPAGKSEITFEFKPTIYYMGERVSFVGSLLSLLILAAAAYRYFAEFKKAIKL